MTKKLSNTKYFCMSPWTHLHFLPNGDVIPCCLSPVSEVVGNIKKQPLEEIWNSEKIKNMRINMLNEKPCSECKRCYDKESTGFSSLRTGMNEKYIHHYGLTDQTKPDGTVEDINLVHWDFRFSNICNFKCRTCGPVFSSNWIDDFKKLYGTTGKYKKIEKTFDDSSRLAEVIDDIIDNVESIHFAGGEPLIMEEHYYIMRKLEEKKKYDVSILYSTNMSKLTYKDINVIDLWQNFTDIEISASLDGMGPEGEYIRKGYVWKDVEKHWFEIKNNCPNMKMRIHPTISVFNILHLIDFHKYILENNWFDKVLRGPNHFGSQVLLNNLIFPDHYSIQILPEKAKKIIYKKYEEYNRWLLDNYGVSGIMAVVDYMLLEDKTNEIPKFFNITDNLDRIRNEQFSVLFPDLNEMLKNG